MSADFATLYTSLPHSLIIDNMYHLTDLLFKNCKRNYLKIRYNDITYTNTFESRNTTLDITMIKELIYTVIKETYINFGDTVLQQRLGVPMGGSCSPDLACMTLSILEYKFLKNNPQLQYQLRHTCRYIDDIINISDTNFMELAKSIYPTTIRLEKTNETSDAATFLDINMKIKENNSLQTKTYNIRFKIYDKRDDFKFKIRKYPTAISNISNNIIRNVLTGQIIRASRICSTRHTFTKEVSRSIYTLYCNGYNHSFTLRCLTHFFAKYETSLWKFGITDTISIAQCVLRCILRAKTLFNKDQKLNAY